MATNETTPAPCQGCGVLSDRNVSWYEVPAHIGPKGPMPPAKFRRSTCDDCATLNFSRPGMAVRACLRLIGRPEADDSLFAGVLADEGYDANVVMYQGGQPSHRPWSHVTSETRKDLRALYAKALLVKVERATPVVPLPPLPPPQERGTEADRCLACGRAEDTDWRGYATLPTRGGGSITGCLCSQCWPVMAHIGSWGTQFTANAYRAHQGLPVDLSIDRLRGLVAWYSLPADRQAETTGEPWSWYTPREPEPIAPDVVALQAQVEALREQVAALQGGTTA